MKRKVTPREKKKSGERRVAKGKGAARPTPLRKMKTSGSEEVYSTFFYSTRPGIDSNNCYGYATGFYGEDEGHKLQPGELSHDLDDVDLSDCKQLRQRILKDIPDMRPAHPDAACPRGTYKLWMFLDPGNDYHFFKQNSDVLIRLRKGDTPASLAARFGVPSKNVIMPRKGEIALVKDARTWSHKRGLATGAILEDACNRIITDPRKACRDYGDLNYSVDCGAFCAPNRMYQYDKPTLTRRQTKPKPKSSKQKSAHAKTR